jgi:hypothetical protein
MSEFTRRSVIAGAGMASVTAALGAAPICLRAQAEGSMQKNGDPPRGWDAPWENRRGFETIDYNNALILIRAPIDDIARALADRTQRWERDVLGREIVLGNHGAFIFRLRGHTWTEIVLDPSIATGIWEQALSSQLKTRVIRYEVSDTMGGVIYGLYENGELLEELEATDNGSGGPDDSTSFSSRVRDLKRDDIADIWDFTRRFLIEQDAFEPGISFEFFLGRRYRPGDRVRVVNPGFTLRTADGQSRVSTPPIERVDYLALLASGR